MKEQHNKSSESAEPGQKKWLVRILLILGIGIPIFIELFTFSGLVSSHLFNEQETEQVDTVRTKNHQHKTIIESGDTLFRESSFPIRLTDMKLKIYPDYWSFTLSVEPDIPSDAHFDRVSMEVFHLKTQNQAMLQNDRVVNWESPDALNNTRPLSWRLESGQRPKSIMLNLQVFTSENADPVQYEKQYHFGHVPARYQR